MRGFLGRAGHVLGRVLATMGLGAATPAALVVAPACTHITAALRTTAMGAFAKRTTLSGAFAPRTQILVAAKDC